MSDTTPKFRLTFRITEDDYLQYNFNMAATSMRKNRRRQTLFGMLWVLIGVVLFASSFVAEEPTAWYMYLINVVIIGFGLYSIVYYRLFFAQNLKKAVKKAYPKSDFLTNDITVIFFEDRFQEIGKDRDNQFFYQEIEGVQFDRDFVTLLCSEKKSLPIPLKALPEGMYDELFKFLRTVCLGEMKLFIDRDAMLPEGMEPVIDWGGRSMEDYDDTPPPLDMSDPDIESDEQKTE